MRVDLHVHTVTSGGTWTMRDAFRYVRTQGLQMFSITDYSQSQALPVPRDLLDRFICGAEVEVEIDGRCAHLLLYGAIDAHTALSRALSAHRLKKHGATSAAPAHTIIRAAVEAGVVSVVAHPLMLEALTDLDRFRQYGVDGIEVWHPSATGAESSGLRNYANRHDLLATAGAAPFDVPPETVARFLQCSMNRVARARAYGPDP